MITQNEASPTPRAIFTLKADTAAHRWLLVVLVALTAVATGYFIGPREFKAGDSVHYFRMAAETPAAVPAPWAYRVAVPKLVSIVPLSIESAFFVMTYLATILTLLVMFRVLLGLGISFTAALVTLPVVALSFPITFYLGHWGMVDPVANLVITLILLCLVQQKYGLATLVLAVGCLVKETTLLLLPLLLWENLHQKNENSAPRLASSLLIVLLPLAVLITLHQSITPLPGAWDIHNLRDAMRQWHFIWAYNARDFGILARISRELLRSYGFFWVVAIFGLVAQTRWRKESIYFLVVGFALCGVATDWSRMLGLAFPGIFIATANFFERIQRLASAKKILAVFVLLAVCQAWVSLLSFDVLAARFQFLLIVAILAVFLAGVALTLSAFLDARESDDLSSYPRCTPHSPSSVPLP